MGRWSDWDAIEAAQAQAAREDRAKERQRRGIRLVLPDEAPPEPVEVSEAVLDGLEESSPPPAPPVDSWRVESAARAREAVDPVAAIRLWARDWLDRIGGDKP